MRFDTLSDDGVNAVIEELASSRCGREPTRASASGLLLLPTGNDRRRALNALYEEHPASRVHIHLAVERVVCVSSVDTRLRTLVGEDGALSRQANRLFAQRRWLARYLATAGLILLVLTPFLTPYLAGLAQSVSSRTLEETLRAAVGELKELRDGDSGTGPAAALPPPAAAEAPANDSPPATGTPATTTRDTATGWQGLAATIARLTDLRSELVTMTTSVSTTGTSLSATSRAIDALNGSLKTLTPRLPSDEALSNYNSAMDALSTALRASAGQSPSADGTAAEGFDATFLGTLVSKARDPVGWSASDGFVRLDLPSGEWKKLEGILNGSSRFGSLPTDILAPIVELNTAVASTKTELDGLKTSLGRAPSPDDIAKIDRAVGEMPTQLNTAVSSLDGAIGEVRKAAGATEVSGIVVAPIVYVTAAIGAMLIVFALTTYLAALRGRDDAFQREVDAELFKLYRGFGEELAERGSPSPVVIERIARLPWSRAGVSEEPTTAITPALATVQEFVKNLPKKL